MIIKALSPKKYLEMFSDAYESIQTENYFFAIMPNEFDDFRQFSYVNGLNVISGGSHIDYISNEVVNRLRDSLQKKYKTIKPGDIRNKLMIVAIMKDFKDLKFDSQTKEKVTNSISEIKSFFGNIDFDGLHKRLMKHSAILDPITEVYKIKEELRLRLEMKGLEKPKGKKIKDEKLLTPIGTWENIFLCEGDSAQNSISKIIGRQGNGFYAMFGVPPNAYDMKIQDILKSDKMKGLQTILGMKYSQTFQDNINFKNIIIATDADLPGFFIRMQLMGMFFRFASNLFDEGRIKILRTPIVIGLDSKENIKEWFYDLDELKEYERGMESGTKKKYKFEYKKGLGSWDQSELDYIISKDGLDNMLETMELDKDAAESIDNWLSGKMADKRKEMLEGFEFSIANM